MLPFLKAAFTISPYQVIIFSLFGLLKYVVNAYHLTDQIQRPFTWTLLISGVIFFLSLTISGFIEKKQDFSESDTTRKKFLTISNRYAKILNLGITVPVVVAAAALLYMIIPAFFTSLVILFVGILITNIFRFYSNKTTTEDQN